MISSGAIKAFLNRELDTHTWIKACPEAELDEAIALLNPRPQFSANLLKEGGLMRHQKACFLLGVAYPGFFLQLDMGVGKTILTLELLRYFMMQGALQRALVEVLSDEGIVTWEDEIARWCPDLPVRGLYRLTSKEKLFSMFNLERGLIVGTHQGIATALCQKQEIRRKGKKDVVKLVPSEKLVRQVSKLFTGFVVDESTMLANHSNLYYRIANPIARNADFRYLLAGRGFNRDPADLWSQYYLIDRGLTLGPHIGVFRQVFYKETRSYFGGPHAMEYTFRKELEPVLSKMLENRSICYADHECTDMPPQKEIVRYVDFPTETKAYYDRLVNELTTARGNYRMVKNAFIRMRQLSSGFLGFIDDETGDRAEVEFKHNPKLDKLLGYITKMPPGRKFVVFYEFTWSGRKISQALKKIKIEHGWIWSQGDDFREIKHRFDTDPKLRGIVVQNKKGNYQLNLQEANYSFVYEAPLSGIDWDQLKKRTKRKGQKRHSFLYDLRMRNSMDDRIRKYHQEGGDLFKALVVDPAQIVGVSKQLDIEYDTGLAK